MVYIDNITVTKLVNHAQFEERVAADLRVLRLLLSHFVYLESLGEVLQARRAVVHKVSELQTGLIFGLLLIERYL